jgi:hypothetical protein
MFCIPSLRSGVRLLMFPLWFLAIAMMVNGVAHPLLGLDARGYFPGLATAPALGVVGAMLWMRLLSLTAGNHASAPARTSPGAT